MENTVLRAEKVAAKVGISTKTLNAWYVYKQNNPENELFQALPDYTRDEHNCRLWNKDDISKIVRFKKQLPRGRKGVMGKYAGKGTGRENGKN